MTMCASGCTLRGEHLTDCDGAMTDRRGETVECGGCLPRPAEYGRLCGRCWGRLQSLVRTMPSLADHLAMMGEPSLSSPMGHTGAAHGRPGESSLYPAAVGVLDDLHALLVSWCVEVAIERGLGLPEAGTRWTAMDSDGTGSRSGQPGRVPRASWWPGWIRTCRGAPASRGPTRCWRTWPPPPAGRCAPSRWSRWSGAPRWRARAAGAPPCWWPRRLRLGRTRQPGAGCAAWSCPRPSGQPPAPRPWRTPRPSTTRSTGD